MGDQAIELVAKPGLMMGGVNIFNMLGMSIIHRNREDDIEHCSVVGLPILGPI